MTRGSALLLAAAAGGLLLLVLLALVVVALLRREQAMAQRVLLVQRSAGIDAAEVQPGQRGSPVLRAVSAIGDVIARSGLLSASTVADLQQTLRVAGLRGRGAKGGLGLFVGAKLLLLLALPLLVWIALRQTGWDPPMRGPLLAGCAIVGLLIPDYVVKSLRRRYLRDLERGLPDALDMLVICSEAGLGLEPAIERVGAEIRDAHPVVAEELGATARDLRLNADRRVALVALGTRTGLEALRRLGGTLVQTLHYGTPLSQALRTLSAELRQESLTRFEARAARLPVLLTLPMIVFILPCVFLVVGGPAVVKVLATIRH